MSRLPLTPDEIHNATKIVAGSNQEFPRLKGCPTCDGRGWFCRDPFAIPRPRDCYVCPTCERSKRHWDEHSELPYDVKAAMEDKP